LRAIAVLFFSTVARVERRQKLAFAGKLPEQKNPAQANPIFRMESGMAYISQRGAYWRAEIRRRGYKPVYRTFDTKQQAQQWAREVESEMDGLFIDRTEAEKTTLREALERYRREIIPEKHYPYQENRRVQRWLDNDLVKAHCSAFGGSGLTLGHACYGSRPRLAAPTTRGSLPPCLSRAEP
jgi:hypothetical protein